MDDFKRTLESNSPLTLDLFMSLCNAHYYNKADPIGARGDFITAPEISQIFGELIGIWIADLWIKLHQPEKITLLECGPGRGTLMADILRGTCHIKGLQAALDIVFLETSNALINQQKKVIKHPHLTWISDIEELAKPQPLICIGNEFLDALPIQQHIYKDQRWHKRHVRAKKGSDYEWHDVFDDHFKSPDRLPPPEDGDFCETSPAIDLFIRQLASKLKIYGGACLFIDYGYYIHAYGDTFQAMSAHKYADPLHRPGEIDLTAHVNFADLANLFEKNHLCTYGPVTQSAFLQNLGLQMRLDQLCSQAEDKQEQLLITGAYRLIAPEQMGTLFKVICATSEPHLIPAGF